MAVCDICNTPTSTTSGGKVFPLKDIRAATDRGFNGMGIGPNAAMLADVGITKQESYARWKSQVASDTTDYLLCPACQKEILRYVQPQRPPVDVAQIEEGFVIVFFHAAWVAPSKLQQTVLDSVGPQIGARAKIVRFDVDDNKEVAERFGISSVPTLLFLRDGQVVAKLVGFCDESKLLAAVENPENTEKDAAGNSGRKGCLLLLALFFLIFFTPVLLALGW